MENKEVLIQKILNRGVEEVIDREHLEKALNSGQKLRVKLGIDPTKPDIHLGHTVPLLKLREFQDLGHQAVLIIGDFTAQIGDPSGQSAERQPLTEKEVKANMKHYLEQAGKVIDVKKTEVRYNSEWHGKSLKDFLAVTKAVSISQIMKREDFQKRIDAGGDVTVLESLYAILQGYDSVMVKADVELGGADQKLNLLMGRRIQRYFKMPEQDILTMPLVEGTDGVRKMSKSYGNYVGLTEKPEEMFGKLMSIPDSLTAKYFTHFTEVEPPKGNPYEAKMLLAETVTRMYHGEKSAAKAKENWIKTFSKRETPEEIEIKFVPSTAPTSGTMATLIALGGKSNSEWRRLLEQGAIKVNGEVVKDPDEKRKDGDMIKIGKKEFIKIKVK